MKDIILRNYPHMIHGADYNPDQWQDRPDILKEDMRLMKLAGFNEMSVGIFAWSCLEPQEGVFDFSFLDKAMDDIYAAGGRVILATPSGARPAWLSQKYPEVLRVGTDRIRNEFGERHNHCYTSPIYREKVRIINEKLAERYANHPALIAWHISNEYGGECHCPLCRAAFREWLKLKYGTLDNLNHEWWTAFWSHTFTDWEQIISPGPLGDSDLLGLTLDWKRFVTDQTTDFISAEIAAVRKFTPNIPVTANLMGFYNGLDYRRLSKKIDFVSWDAYPKWRGNDKSDISVAINASMTHDLMRSLKKRPFFLMESTPSLVNWHEYNKLKRPGMNELSSLQAVAHGADSVQYFQWRKSRGSSEKFHGAVVDHVGTENTRVFKEVAALGSRLKGLEFIVGTMPDAKAALLYDWDNRWALDNSQGFARYDKKIIPTLQSYYGALWKRGIDTDIIGAEDCFDGYRLIIAPMRYSVSAALGEKLKKFVENGGTLLFTYISAMVNENDLCYLGGFPGAGLSEVFGIWNEEIDTLYPGEKNSVKLGDEEYAATDYCELIHTNTAEVLAVYSQDFYSGMPALTVNKYGKGRAYYQAFRDEGEFTDRLVSELLKECEIGSVFDGELPEGVTAHGRTDGDSTYAFIQNFTYSEKTLETKTEWLNAESGEKINGSIVLKPLQTLILKH